MKKLSLLAFALVVLVACNSDKKKEESVVETETQEIAYQSFGEKITAENVISRDDLIEKYKNLKPRKRENNALCHKYVIEIEFLAM